MRNKRYRRKYRWNVARIFMVTVLFLVFLGVIVTWRSRRIEAEREREAQGVSETKEKKDSEETIKKIFADKTRYPDELLEMLERNPDMADFVAGYPEADRKKVGSFSQKEIEADHPLLIQYDKRWGYYKYGDSMIAVSGCGPVCLSMVILGMRHEAVLPTKICKFCEKEGYYVQGSGTSWQLMTEGAAHFGLMAREISLSESSMLNVLDTGGMIICAMRPGDFTTTGHFIVIYGYDGEGFLVNDPNSRQRSSKSWGFDELSGQIKNLWGYTG